jgi:hypothetical protein
MNQFHVRLRVARELAVVRQDDVAAELRHRGVKFNQSDLSNLECGIRPLSSALARQIGEVLVGILEARTEAVKELLSSPK